MIKIINSNKMESFDIIEYKYKNCNILISEFIDDFNGNLKGKVYAVCDNIYEDSEFQDICYDLIKQGYDAILIGSYGEVSLGVQFEYKE